MSKPIVFQAAKGKHEQLLRMTEGRHRELFKDCIYHAFYGQPDDFFKTDGAYWHFNFIKWYWLRRFFDNSPDGTTVAWLDADVFVEEWFDVGGVIPEGMDFAAVRSAYGIFNMGVFFWRNSRKSRLVLGQMIMAGPEYWRPVEDGTAANRFLGSLGCVALHTGFNKYLNARGERGPLLVRAFHAEGWDKQLRGICECCRLSG